MSGDSSEEKTLPPTQRKLRKAREKGQVVTSRETLASLTTLAVLLYLFARRGAIWRDLRALFALETPPGLAFPQELALKARMALDLAVGLVAPVLVLVIALTVLMGMAISGGPVFSAQALTPDFGKLSPAKGAKKMFGRSAWMRLLMHVVRILAVGALLAVLLGGQIGALLPAPPCGIDCAARITERMIVPLLVGLTAILVVAGLLDYLVQRAEFLREQRMSVTEMKREWKDQEGDPQLKGQLRADRREAIERPVGLSEATVLIRAGTREIVGLRYVEGETPAPRLVFRARGPEAVARAARNRAELTVREDAEAVALLARLAIGDWISTDAQIAAVSPHLR